MITGEYTFIFKIPDRRHLELKKICGAREETIIQKFPSLSNAYQILLGEPFRFTSHQWTARTSNSVLQADLHLHNENAHYIPIKTAISLDRNSTATRKVSFKE